MENLDIQNKISENNKMDTIKVLFEKSFSSYKNILWKSIVFTSLIPFLCIFFIGMFLGGLFIADMSMLSKVLLFSLCILLFSIIFFWTKTGALFLIKEQDHIKKIFIKSKKYIWSYFVINILLIFLVFGGSIFFLIPGLILGVFSVFSFFVLINEDKKDLDAISQSFYYVKGYFWQILGRISIIFLIYLILSLIPFIGGIIIVFFMAPFMLVFLNEIYKNIRTLKEDKDNNINKLKTKNLSMIFILLGILSLFFFLFVILSLA